MAWNPYDEEDSNEEDLSQATEEEENWFGQTPKQKKQDERLRSDVRGYIHNGQSEQATALLLERMASKQSFNQYEWSGIQRDVASSLADQQHWEKALAIAWSI